jgi:ribosomal protein S11
MFWLKEKLKSTRNYKIVKTEQRNHKDPLLCNFKTTKNNFFINFSSSEGKLLIKSSGGLFFNGSQRNTPFAVDFLRQHCFNLLLPRIGKPEKVELHLDSPLNSKLVKTFVSGFKGTPFKIIRIRDVTRIAHNGCKKKKKRRV